MMSTNRLEGGGQLPGEILHDIFCRLPVQSLSQCRFVCKHWYNLIVNDPVFVNLYNSRHQSSESTPSLFVVCHITTGQHQLFYLADINQNNSTTLPPLEAINVYFNWHMDVVGSSNGLLCLCSLPTYDLIYIFNPVTREILKLPKPNAQNCKTNNNNLDITFIGAGFAFHAPTNTYKVVLTWYFFRKCKLQTGIEIYTVGSGIWRSIDQGKNYQVSDDNSKTSQVYLNGALHLMMVDHRYRHYIGAIDLGDENVTTFLQPSLDRELVKTRTLTSLHHYLCLTDDLRIDIWIMKQYGVGGLWSKEYVIRKEILPYALQRKVSVNTSVAMKKNGCITVLLQGGEFNEYKGYYDLETREYKEILIHGIQSPGNNLEFVLHNCSLISPKSIAGTGEDYQFPPIIPTRQNKYRLKRKKLHQRWLRALRLHQARLKRY